jgi:hypothetical protein
MPQCFQKAGMLSSAVAAVSITSVFLSYINRLPAHGKPSLLPLLHLPNQPSESLPPAPELQANHSHQQALLSPPSPSATVNNFTNNFADEMSPLMSITTTRQQAPWEKHRLWTAKHIAPQSGRSDGAGPSRPEQHTASSSYG